jgi:uncharacterized RDD family membrane protein YckC
MSATATAAPCPLWRRLLALLYDLLVVLALVLAVGYASQRATGGRLFDAGNHPAWWYQPLQGLVVAAYFLFSWLRGGQTLGMRAWRLRLAGRDGARLRWPQALRRLLAAALPLLLLALGGPYGARAALWAVAAAWTAWFAVALFDPRRRALHDLAGGTVLLRLGAR